MVSSRVGPPIRSFSCDSHCTLASTPPAPQLWQNIACRGRKPCFSRTRAVTRASPARNPAQHACCRTAAFDHRTVLMFGMPLR